MAKKIFNQATGRYANRAGIFDTELKPIDEAMPAGRTNIQPDLTGINFSNDQPDIGNPVQDFKDATNRPSYGVLANYQNPDTQQAPFDIGEIAQRGIKYPTKTNGVLQSDQNPIQQKKQQNQQTDATLSQDESRTTESNLGLLGGLAGAGIGIYNNLNRGSTEKSYWEGRAAQKENEANRERILSQDPEANRRASAMALQQAKAGSVAQAANIGANAANAGGLGGSVNSAQLAGIRAASPVLQASGQYDQALAGLNAQKANEEAQQNNQLVQNTGQRFQIDDSRHYVDKPKTSMLEGILPMIQGGTATGLALSTVNNSKDKQLTKGK